MRWSLCGHHLLYRCRRLSELCTIAGGKEEQSSSPMPDLKEMWFGLYSSQVHLLWLQMNYCMISGRTGQQGIQRERWRGRGVGCDLFPNTIPPLVPADAWFNSTSRERSMDSLHFISSGAIEVQQQQHLLPWNACRSWSWSSCRSVAFGYT